MNPRARGTGPDRSEYKNWIDKISLEPLVLGWRYKTGEYVLYRDGSNKELLKANVQQP